MITSAQIPNKHFSMAIRKLLVKLQNSGRQNPTNLATLLIVSANKKTLRLK